MSTRRLRTSERTVPRPSGAGVADRRDTSTPQSHPQKYSQFSIECSLTAPVKRPARRTGRSMKQRKPTPRRRRRRTPCRTRPTAPATSKQRVPRPFSPEPRDSCRLFSLYGQTAAPRMEKRCPPPSPRRSDDAAHRKGLRACLVATFAIQLAG